MELRHWQVKRKASQFASEGQQRSVALALKLGQASLLEASSDAPPLFLVDDVFGELDQMRRNNLISALPVSAQKLITATSLRWRDDAAPAAIFELQNGALTRSA